MTLLGAVAAGVGALVVALVLLPAHAALPLLGAGLTVAAATLVLITLAAPDEVARARVMVWDMAGALLLIGLCAAGLAGEAEPALVLIETER
jgi:hypothetical protein